ncbi:MAG: hypothetical protein ACRC0Y_03930 [Fusobacteriaceae bacterium]
MRKLRGWGLMNEIVEITEVILGYEDEGLFESSSMILMVSDCKFMFRSLGTDEVESIEYAYIDRKYDNVDFTDEDIETMEFCVSKAQEYGFYVG